ncbi:formiminotetrahydrofolate cyclodeaminase [Dysgonomonas sp. PFB1-18]|uniref:cyclodeaminase/cyclohydrolase family protein n=1 Tax=unclassified Dysgonomonas TaxID=2630389 RepID=UPI002475F484|nr:MULTISPECIES: cyclodeaminase/cyclohydrolase family protein [unclassified Dysgonomonas]MDH6308963.1 formiminotetrahydrofolate cyclodeaminase [Dysgonomonas sp. PF1-14]MDH6338714.1 formiminotetrahydrofolate cyclodeaminase [Dysgonomonas sp. PF1-16]MDH6380258.1 formiminotetrahydrofolate cyclodeaminase [Dysgonomonas sp. PFB1-18]MDH6397588.1 formiminotetrahydrofolate cyclodeaminase [Dysgonomonas sp. PF1-23]
MLIDLTIKEFLAKTAGSDPVPGGGSIAALNGAIASGLAEMVANLTIGKKKYEDREEQMKQLAASMNNHQVFFLKDIDADSDAYNKVFAAFKLPKETDEEKAERSKQIQAATKIAAEVPMEVARRAYTIMGLIAEVAENGNQNAITDACVSMMSARTAVLGAILNVKINLSSLKDEAYVAKMKAECDQLEKDAIAKEQELLSKVNKML